VLIIYVDENGNVNEQGTTATDVVVQGNTQPVTSDAVATAIQQGSLGIPVGAVLSFPAGTTQAGWLLCDGRDTTGTAEELQTHYPALYTYLGNSNVLPDYRECTLVGVGQNDTDTIAEHDVYTLGEFKDDQLQDHTHDLPTELAQLEHYAAGAAQDWAKTNTTTTVLHTNTSTVTNTYRTGTTTHGKQKGVAYYIKATSAGPEVEPDIYATKGYIRDQNVLSEWEAITIPTTAETAMTMMYDGYITCSSSRDSEIYIYVDGHVEAVSISRTSEWSYPSINAFPFKKGQSIYAKVVHGSLDTNFSRVAYYKLRDYTGR
jgi:hypothetical protein